MLDFEPLHSSGRSIDSSIDLPDFAGIVIEGARFDGDASVERPWPHVRLAVLVLLDDRHGAQGPTESLQKLRGHEGEALRRRTDNENDGALQELGRVTVAVQPVKVAFPAVAELVAVSVSVVVDAKVAVPLDKVRSVTTNTQQ